MKKTFKTYEEMLKYYGITPKETNHWGTTGKPTKNVKKSQNSVKKAINLSKKINDMTTTPTKRSKKHEHKPNNNIRLQITIDCRIL